MVTLAVRRSFDKHAPALSHPAPAEALWVYTLFHRIIMWTRLVRHGIDPASDGPAGLARSARYEPIARRRWRKVVC